MSTSTHVSTSIGLENSIIDSNYTLINNIKSFIQNNDFKDFVLTVNEAKFDVHRFLLEARSSYLGELIRDNPEVQSLNLDHQISPENFQFVIDFLYYDKMPPENADMLEIFEVAGRWEMKNLTNFTGVKILDNSTPEQALEIFLLNDKFKISEELKKMAFDKIRNSLPGVHFSANLLHESAKLKKLMEAKRKFDEIIEKDLRKIEELNKEVEKKQNEKAEWIKRIMNSDDNCV